MVGDPVGDFIIRLKNAGRVRKSTVVAPYSKLRHAIATKLQAVGYVENVTKEGEGKDETLIVTLKYSDGTHAITDVQRMSTPGCRLYCKVSEIHPVKFGKGSMILSTPAGILTDSEAREQHVGGEQLFKVW